MCILEGGISTHSCALIDVLVFKAHILVHQWDKWPLKASLKLHVEPVKDVQKHFENIQYDLVEGEGNLHILSKYDSLSFSNHE